mgnify:CR=1 FL=1
MENSLVVAKALYDMYAERTNSSMDEMKMHKLMYFAQRESLMNTSAPLFHESFYGWKFGPVLKSVRSEYATGQKFSDVAGAVQPETKVLLDEVLDRYGDVSSWKLSSLSHDELSWKMARRGLKPSNNGDVELTLSGMMLDAARERAARKAQTACK